MNTFTQAAFVAALLSAACASSKAPEKGPTSENSPELLAQVALVDARRLMIEGDPRDAMVELDTALELQGEKVEVQFLRGEATLRMGVEDGNAFFFEDSRSAFLDAAATGEAPSAWFGAARATWLLFFQSGDGAQLEEALGYLDKGIEVRSPDARFERYFGASPERTVAEVRFSAYRASKDGTLPEERTAEYFEAARDAIEAEIALDTTATWGWGQLANLYLWEERREDARTTIGTGIGLNPEDSTLHETQTRLAEEDGGWAEVQRLYAEFTEQHQGIAIGHWWLAQSTYEVALETMLEKQDDQSEAFAAAEASFLRTRELQTDYTESCMAYEVICRDGMGWSHFYADDFEKAEAAFWSMEEVFEGGLLWEVQDRLWSGVRSLNFLLAEYNTRWELLFDREAGKTYTESFEFLKKAAALANKIYEYDSQDRNHGNNAGYFNRDIAVQYEAQGTLALQAEEVDEERIGELFDKAGEHMELSYTAYVQAAKLSPQDARVINDTGLILTYYLQRDLDAARDYFERSIAVGLPQLEAGIEDEEARTMTREAVGDAYQNLGVLALTLEGDAATARRLFEKSLDYERNPRVQVTTFFLPLCERIESGKIAAAKAIQAHYWKDLEIEQVRQREEVMTELRKALAQE